jgi:beta-glucosidase
MPEAFPEFPKGFVFGAAASAYQIEGTWDADGKGLSIWDAFAHTKGKIKHAETGDVVCDHYHRYPDDILLMKALGLDAYRGSISWPRILPEGVGKPNPAGIGFYSRLTDALLEAGVTPYWTLFH